MTSGSLPFPAEDTDALKRHILVHNERTKLTATAANNAAIALFGGGFLLPIIGLSFPPSSAPPQGQVTLITMIFWALVAAGLHGWGRTMLGGLVMDANPTWLLFPPLFALAAAWLGWRSIKRGASAIDAERTSLRHRPTASSEPRRSAG